MPGDDPTVAADLERDRRYLTKLAASRVDAGLRQRVDISGLVQETLLEAWQCRDRARGGTEPRRKAWLRGILEHNLADALRNLRMGKRDVRREQPLLDLLAAPCARPATRLVAAAPTPDQVVELDERARRVAAAVARLAPGQREALLAHYWHGRSVADIAVALRRSRAAVAGLLKRALQELRVLLAGTDAL
jgi:RNA polymerase sigma-70 factor, ECF subfamily